MLLLTLRKHVEQRAHLANPRHVAPHDLRRTAASILHNARTESGSHLFDLLDIQQVLRHPARRGAQGPVLPSQASIPGERLRPCRGTNSLQTLSPQDSPNPCSPPLTYPSLTHVKRPLPYTHRLFLPNL